MASSVPATVRNSHFFLPVAASTPKIGPRPGHSPPCAPMITVSLAYKRRAGEADRQLLGIDQLGVPDQLAGLHVERDQPAVHRADIELALADARCRDCRASGSAGRPAPRRVPGNRTRSPRRWRRSAQRRGCRSPSSRARRRPRAASTAGRGWRVREYGSRRPQIRDVAGVDLVERAVVIGLVGAVIGQPVILAAGLDARGIHRLSKC